MIDLGCGPGNSTALLARRWPKAKLEGLDSSEPMLDQARRSGINATWLSGDIPGWTPKKRYDVIFTNATIQWIAEQDTLLPRLMSYLEPGGIFAFQVPTNFNEPSHRLMRDVAAEGPWAGKLTNIRNITLGTPRGYYEILEPHSVVARHLGDRISPGAQRRRRRVPLGQWQRVASLRECAQRHRTRSLHRANTRSA